MTRRANIEEIKARCEANTGWQCTLGCTVKCRKIELDKKLGRSRRGRVDAAKENADRYAARIEALGRQLNEQALRESERAAAQKMAVRILKKRHKALQEEKHGYDGQKPVIRHMKVAGIHGVMVDTAVRKVAEMRRRDDSFTEDMEKAAIKLEHDWRLVHDAAIRGQAIKEFVDGSGHDVDPNIPAMEANARLDEARGAIGDSAFTLLVLVFVKGEPVREIGKLTKLSHSTITDMAKEALNSLGIHYGYVRSHLSQKRLTAMQERLDQWRRMIP